MKLNPKQILLYSGDRDSKCIPSSSDISPWVLRLITWSLCGCVFLVAIETLKKSYPDLFTEQTWSRAPRNPWEGCHALPLALDQTYFLRTRCRNSTLFRKGWGAQGEAHACSAEGGRAPALSSIGAITSPTPQQSRHFAPHSNFLLKTTKHTRALVKHIRLHLS